MGYDNLSRENYEEGSSRLGLITPTEGDQEA